MLACSRYRRLASHVLAMFLVRCCRQADGELWLCRTVIPWFSSFACFQCPDSQAARSGELAVDILGLLACGTQRGPGSGQIGLLIGAPTLLTRSERADVTSWPPL